MLTKSRYRFALLLIGADLFAFALACLPQTDPAALAPDPRVAKYLAGTSGRDRYLIYSIAGIIDPGLPYHLGLRIDADTIDSFSRLPPASAARRLAELYPAIIKTENGRLRQYDQMALRDPQKIDRRRLGLLNDLNVRWLVGRSPWPHGDAPLKLVPVFSTPPGNPRPLFIYRNDAARSERGFIRRGADKLIEPIYPRHSGLFQVGPLGWGGGTVNVSESWYPGWRAEVGPAESGNHIETRIDQDDLGLMQVKGKEGDAIWMTFAPISFRVGLWAGLAALAGALALAVGRVRNPAPPPPG